MIDSENSVVYVACPSRAATGGPELLHQLVHSLRSNGIEAYMYYHPVIDDPVHEAYKAYSNPFVFTIEDTDSNIIVVPELKRFIDLLDDFRSIQKMIWWLSVDNFYKGYIKNSLANRCMNKLSNISEFFARFSYEERARLLSKKYDLLAVNQIAKADYHLVQSHYAYEHLVNKGIHSSKLSYLSDYVNDSFLGLDLDKMKKDKRDFVIYNPKKGFYFTKKIINSLPHVEFKALQNMTRNEVINTMVSSKVYIDFGNHPGKDRMPREAALCGNCIITGRRGSAGNNVDVPIPDQYKFDDRSENITHICNTIRECIRDYERTIEDFSDYRERIRNEKSVFDNEVRSIFSR